MTIHNVLDIAIVPIWKFRNFDFWGEDHDGEPMRSIKCSTCANLNVNLYTCWNLKGWNCVLLRVLIILEENNESLDIFFHIVMANSSVIFCLSQTPRFTNSWLNDVIHAIMFLSEFDRLGIVWNLERFYGIRIHFQNIAERTLLDGEHFKSLALLAARIARHIRFVIFPTFSTQFAV